MNRHRRLMFSAAFWFVPAVTFSSPALARAEHIQDPHPPLRWEQMVDCELVVLGKYRSHEGNRLLLETIRVLKGPSLPEGAVIPVNLEHWYSIETGLIGWEALMKDAKPDGIPKLCYKAQMTNPGSLSPHRVVPDVRESNLYFLPKLRSPKLDRRGQVQPAILVDGWKQALDARPMDLPFRLAQDVNPALQRDALEELYESRNPAAIEQLLDWILSPPWKDYFILPADEMLVAIGDRAGDVYDRARKRVVEKASGTSEYRFNTLGHILAETDPDRAIRDFKDWSAANDVELRRVAAGCAGFIGNEEALKLTFSLLADEQVAGQAVWSVHLLVGAHEGRVYKRTHAEQVRLREQGILLLKTALTQDDIAAAIKKNLHSSFYPLLDEPSEIDLARAAEVLLNPGEPVFDNHGDSAGGKLLHQMKNAPDPRFIPLLVKVLKDIKASPHSYPFGEVLSLHAKLFPDAVLRELGRVGLANQLPADRSETSFNLISKLNRHFGTPQNLDELQDTHRFRRRDGKFQPITISPKLKAELIRFLEHYIALSAGPNSTQLELLFEIDPAEGKRLLEKALARRADYAAHTQLGLLLVASRYGHAEVRDELKAAIRETVKQEREKGQVPWSAASLLELDDAESYDEFLKFLDGLNQTKYSLFDNDLWFNWDYFRLAWKLFESHRAEYFRRVLEALQSDSLPVRAAGQQELEFRFGWNFGFDARDFRPVRREQLAKLRPIVEQLTNMTQPEIRGHVLRERGVKLDRPAGPAWLSALCEAVGHHDPAVYENVLYLVEEFTGEVGCHEKIHRLNSNARRRALAAYLADRANK